MKTGTMIIARIRGETMKRLRENRFFLILTLASILLASNCATITRKTKQRIPVTSTPVGAAVIVNGVRKGVTPLEIRLARKEKAAVIRIESPGYDPVEIRPEPKRSRGLFSRNFLLGLIPATPIFIYLGSRWGDEANPGEQPFRRHQVDPGPKGLR
jgi:PEGA domain